jgi:HAD superfamily hydrolase (TIGR01549 family)
VLLHPNWKRVADALRRQGVAVAAHALTAAEPHARRELDSAEQVRASSDASRARLYFQRVLSHAGITLSQRTSAALTELCRYHEQWNLWESVAPDAGTALARLRAAGFKLVVVSNANGTLGAHMERLGLASRFDLVLDSHDEGVEKPDPRFFQIALERSDSRPETTLHAGDLYEVDVVGARAAGLRAVLLDAAGLYAGCDCPRVSSLDALAQALVDGAL